MSLLLLVLCAIIFGYSYVTNSRHVKELAEEYLSDLVGGKVTVDSATLSVFEGLRLEGVRVCVDDGDSPDSLIFSAQAFSLKYDPFKIVRGQLEAAQIIAQKPHVYLTENSETHDWNIGRLGKNKSRVNKPPPPPSAEPFRPPRLPELLLRNAHVEISELRDGVISKVGDEAMDGQLAPTAAPGGFRFELQTRGAEGIGPWATGTASIAGGPVDVELHDFDFGRDVHALLWQNVREFWERHNMSGRIEVVKLHFLPGHADRKPTFSAMVRLSDINANVPIEDWLSPIELRRRAALRDGIGLMRSLYRSAGYRAAAGDRAVAPPQLQTGAVSQLALAGDARAALAIGQGSIVHYPAASFDPAHSPADVVALLTGSSPFELRGGSGTFIFSDAGIDVKDLTGRVENNAFVINARLGGYSPDAPFSVSLKSLDGDTLQIPTMPRYITSLPPIVRDIYTMLKPDGRCTVDVGVQRKTPGGKPLIDGHVDIVDGVFSSIFFPYPLRRTHGRIAFGYDEQAGADFVHVINMRGRGIAGGPNADSWITVDADIGPLNTNDPQIVIRAKGTGIHSERALLNAFPREVKEPLKIFDAEGKGEYPIFRGDFSTTVLHRPGWAWRWDYDTDLHLDDASGRLVGFPYLLEHISGDVQVRNGFVDVINAHAKRGDATLRVDGRVTWSEPPRPDAPQADPMITVDMNVAVNNLPIDRELLSAVPPEDAVWLKRVGLGGRLDVAGRVYMGLTDEARPTAPIKPDDVRFALGIHLHDGTLWPANGTFSVGDLDAHARLTPEFIAIDDFQGRRGASTLGGDGAIRFGAGTPELAVHVRAADLQTDASLYNLLPAPARQAWDQVEPRGKVDADVTFRSLLGESTEHAPADPYAVALPAFDSIQPGLYATLWPKGLTCAISVLPYRLDDVRGKIYITPRQVTVDHVTARHGNASMMASGHGSVAGRSTWDLKISGRDMTIDGELRRAMPPALITVIDAVKFRGQVDFDFPKFIYRGEGLQFDDAATRPVAAATSHPATASAFPGVDIDLTSNVTLKNCGLDIGVPMIDVRGALTVNAAVRDGKVDAVEGRLNLQNVSAASRNLADVQLDLKKPSGLDELHLTHVQAALAGGQVAGEAHLFYPDDGASHYNLSMVLRDADLETLIRDAGKDIKGDLTASVSLEGDWNDSSARRGRGDVLVSGRELYHLPMILGLFQVTNLSLPIATPFHTGAVRYNVKGQRINFERVELRSDNMLMTGDGHLDFKTKKVEMAFTTDSPGGIKLPLIHDLLNNARGELMRFKILGSIQEPKVQADPFGTVTTTVDEVFSGKP